MEDRPWVSRKAAIGIVVERTGWTLERADVWLEAQAALGRVRIRRPVVVGRMADRTRFRQLDATCRLAELEGALSAGGHRPAPAIALPARRIPRASVRAWLSERHAEAGPGPTERQDVAAAQQQFPDITRALVREERRKLLDPEQLKPGRRRNCAEK